MNLRPLCTAIVWPMESGTIVERRDHVFTTFFSLRVFSASTFTRRWPSTNGPFFSERAIDSLFLHAPQAHPLRSPHLLKSAHRTRNSVRSWAEGAYEARTLRVRNAFHDYRPTVLAQLVQYRLQRNRYNFYRPHRLYCRLRCRYSLRRCALRRPFYGRPAYCPSRRTSSRTACCSAARTASRFPCRSHRLRSRRTALPSPPGTCDFRLPRCNELRYSRYVFCYFRRCTICLSVRLLCRVFLPSVGNAHGVC